MSSVLVEDKPFWKSPAAFVTLGVLVVGALKALGIVDDASADSVNDLVKSAIESAFLFGTAIIGLIHLFKKETAVEVEKMAIRREMLVQDTLKLRLGITEDKTE